MEDFEPECIEPKLLEKRKLEALRRRGLEDLTVFPEGAEFITNLGAKFLADFIMHMDSFSYVGLQPQNALFCAKAIQSTPEGLNRCIDSDRALMEEVRRTKRTARRFCHAGFLEVVIPVLVEGKIIHCLWVGKLRLKPFTDEELKRIAQNCKVDLDLLKRYASRVRVVTEEEAENLIRLYEGIAHILGRAAEEQIKLRETQRKLAEAEKMRALAEVASEIAHHFYNMLTCILGFSELLLMRETDKEKRRMLEIIANVGRSGVEVVRKIRRFALSGGKVEAEPVDVAEAVKEALKMVEPQIRRCQRKIKVRVRYSQPRRSLPKVMANKYDLRDAFVDILTNAIEAMPRGGEVVVTLGKRRNWLTVTFKDTGKGMSKEVLERAFEPFFTTKGPSRYGLGLSAALGAIRRYGGDISIESEKGKGAKVTVRLPLPS